jgi:hypothetical protein
VFDGSQSREEAEQAATHKLHGGGDGSVGSLLADQRSRWAANYRSLRDRVNPHPVATADIHLPAKLLKSRANIIE